MLTMVERAAGHLPEFLPNWEAHCGELLRFVSAGPQNAFSVKRCLHKQCQMAL